MQDWTRGCPCRRSSCGRGSPWHREAALAAWVRGTPAPSSDDLSVNNELQIIQFRRGSVTAPPAGRVWASREDESKQKTEGESERNKA
ncbi:hypothetical protein NDU88_005446 [Pleurodeles waltl]|uniref:Uncharacterized protein n=1 Tax=Pleurodeles waltl TaxID=8319 RepID=A0AAV7L2E0_PLEWA|nr:hypothetical protein NDU88_005446 [Pleurodeles waltl]